ncbi:prion-inhibition and propagation-domain-containing protein [Microdochium trichocladiopsis]|uniref:Prion-inhibition and propagation-domain-containing protein n=1 Tax=Microdochium trichocladiopsis TaxID=1682393 RepID=A0A9P8Y7D5_9PEZI|nr:prion-inhibition and propagation-domain-containing protein [Microdochium trichocladiopsis]KAH7029511.1 prion-inhibition and propagation-domain-containing protein [Microdochium trichocladiopsis]
MAETFGIITGALSVAALFNNAVDTFGYIQLGRSFKQDYTTCQLKLEVARVRLGRWGEAVSINESPRFPSEFPVRAMLGQINNLFSELHEASGRYVKAPTTSDAEHAICDSTTDLDKPAVKVLTVFRRITKRRERKGPGWMEKTYWAIYDAKNFEKLIADVVQLVDGLYQVAPPPGAIRGQPSPEVVEWEFEELDNDASSLKLIQDASADVDNALYETTTEKIKALGSSDNSIGKFSSVDEAEARVGDEWTAEAMRAAGSNFMLRSTRNRVGEAEMKGKSKLIVGTIYK